MLLDSVFKTQGGHLLQSLQLHSSRSLKPVLIFKSILVRVNFGSVAMIPLLIQRRRILDLEDFY